MKPLEFTPNLETGNRDMDGHVRTLLALGNEILFAEAQPASASPFQDAMALFVAYLQYHCMSEESVMVEEDYPSRHIHSALHAYVRHEAAALKRRAYKGGASEELRDIVRSMIEDWLICHVQVDDRQLARFLRETPATRASARLPGIFDLKTSGLLSPDFDEEMVKRALLLGHRERLAWTSPVVEEDQRSRYQASNGP